MQHIAETPYLNHAECSDMIFTSREIKHLTENTREPLNKTIYQRTLQLHEDRKIYVRIIIVTILLNIAFIVTAFSQLVTNKNVIISNTSQITVGGDVQNENGTIISNDGTIDLTGNWINNSGNNGFANSAGTVILNGANQTIGGSTSTTFNNLTLLGSGTKTLLTDATTGGNYPSPAGVLNVGNVILDLNSNTLSVFNSSTSAITSSLGYILSEDVDNSSKVKWSINNSFGPHIIPFGNSAGAKIPVTVTINTGNAGDVTVSTYPTAADNLPLPVSPTVVTQINDLGGSDNSANTVDRFWQVDKTGLVCNATFSLVYANTEAAVNGNAGTAAQRWNVTNLGWEPALPGQSNPVANTVVVPGVTNFGTWAVSRSASPLPVKMLWYNAKAVNNKKVRNEWATASELNNDFFTVERSKDGIHFEEVGKVKGAGTSNDMRDYSFDDMKPMKGVSFYRLKQTDFNGDFAYSETRTVTITSDENYAIEIFPNPAVDFVNVSSSEEDLAIIVTDMQGKIIMQTNAQAPGTRLNFTSLVAGNYFVIIKSPDGSIAKTTKIVKQ